MAQEQEQEQVQGAEQEHEQEQEEQGQEQYQQDGWPEDVPDYMCPKRGTNSCECLSCR